MRQSSGYSRHLHSVSSVSDELPESRIGIQNFEQLNNEVISLLIFIITIPESVIRVK